MRMTLGVITEKTRRSSAMFSFCSLIIVLYNNIVWVHCSWHICGHDSTYN